MDIGEFARKTAPVIYTTSDAGAKYLYNYLNKTGQTDWLDNVMAEYLAFKYVIATEEIRSNVSDKEQFNDIFYTLSLELKNGMERMPASMNYGLTFDSFVSTSYEYSSKNSLEMAFMFQVRTFVIPTTVAQELYNITRQDVINSFARVLNGQSANAGCGCASAIACMALLAVMILCIVVL